MFATFYKYAPTRAPFLRSLALAMLTALLAFSSTAIAQRYKSIAPQIEGRAAKALGSEANSALRNATAFNAGGKGKIDDYFKKYYFPTMTQSSPNALRLLGGRREGLLKRLRGAESAAQSHLTDLTLGVMRVIARDNYHPAVRYNATLLLGMLDKQYPTSGSNPTAPIMLTAGTNDLLELLELNEFNGVKVHPSVKVGALEGLERHARFGMDAQYTDRTTKSAMAILSQEPAALDVDNEVNNWMKCQAARVLARQFKAGPSQEVHAAMTKLIADEAMGLEDRCCIVGLLEKMKYTSGAVPEVKATVVPLGKLTKAVVAEGAEVAREFESLVLGETPGGRPRPRSNFGNRDGDTGPKLERRQLLSRLVQIEAGAKALSNGLADEDKQKLQSLTALLMPVIDQSKDEDVLDLDVTGIVTQLESSVDTLVASWQPAPAAAAAADEAFSE